MIWKGAALLMLTGAPVFAASGVVVTVRDTQNKPVANALVYVYKAPGKHRAPKKPAVMDQVNKLFVPHILPVMVGTSVTFPNKDHIHHHVYSFSKPKKFDLPLYKKDEARPPITFESTGVVKLGCNIHDWMQGYIVVLENPYFALTDKNGRARLEGMRPGEYQIALWSDRRKQPVEESLKKAVLGKKDVAVNFALKFSLPYTPVRHETY